jgi:BASS family bile acid:Na+ symporter
MLLITSCDLSLKTIRFHRAYLLLLAIQALGSAFVYWILSYFSPLLGEGAMICILAPTAMAAAVITGMLGGSVAFAATYTLFGSLCVALLAPFYFAWTGARGDLPFLASAWEVCYRVVPLLVVPVVAAFLLERFLPPVYRVLRRIRPWTYYLWIFGLTIVSGRTVAFVAEHAHAGLLEGMGLALVALVICIAQFVLGRRIGRCHDNAIAAGQSLGQKNTILAIWMAQLYLHPLASIAPAAYVLWQNCINSFQLWKHDRRTPKTKFSERQC